jgi:hypothetical protein
MDFDIPNSEQDNFSPQVTGVEPSTTETNDTFIPVNGNICNTITNAMDLETSVTGNSGISILFIEMYKNMKISNQFSLGVCTKNCVPYKFGGQLKITKIIVVRSHTEVDV